MSIERMVMSYTIQNVKAKELEKKIVLLNQQFFAYVAE